MSRSHFGFVCEGAALAASLDVPEGAQARTGLLIVSGGNEIRAGAAASQALLATRIAGAGHAVLRFDRRGIGDSEGNNAGFRGSAPDIAAALAEFRRRQPGLGRIVAYGNCDAASALMLAGGGLSETGRVDALVLANPWTFEEDNAGPSVRALRVHYRKRLTNLAALERLVTGKVSLVKMIRSLVRLTRPAPPPSTLTMAMRAGLEGFAGGVRILVAGHDYTAQAFVEAWGKDARIVTCAEADHNFSGDAAGDWLAMRLLAMLG